MVANFAAIQLDSKGVVEAFGGKIACREGRQHPMQLLHWRFASESCSNRKRQAAECLRLCQRFWSCAGCRHELMRTLVDGGSYCLRQTRHCLRRLGLSPLAECVEAPCKLSLDLALSEALGRDDP